MKKISKIMEVFGAVMFLIGGCSMDNPTVVMFLTAVCGIGIAFGGYEIERLC